MDQDCFFENANGFKRQSECKKDGVGDENHGKSCGIDLLCTNTSFVWKTGCLKAEFRQMEAKAFTKQQIQLFSFSVTQKIRPLLNVKFCLEVGWIKYVDTANIGSLIK